MERCEECGFDPADLRPADMVVAIRSFGRRYQAPLTRGLAGEDLDTIVRTGEDIVFSAPDEDHGAIATTLDGLDGVTWSARDDLGKVSVIGAGMKSHPGIAARTFATLSDLGIDAPVVTTSPIKIACYVARDEVERAVAALHHAFELDTPVAERSPA